jgi:uncharacterized membrane protein
MIVSLPIGLWIFSLACDLISALGWGGVVWHDMAFYTMAGGILGALLAAVPGLVDFLSLSDATVKKLGAAHLSLNLFIVGLFVLNLWLRVTNEPSALLPVALSVFAIVLLAVAGWLGGEMVYVHGVAVEPQHDRTIQGGEVLTPEGYDNVAVKPQHDRTIKDKQKVHVV